MERALAANAEIAAREGHPPSAAGLDFARTRLTDPTGPWSASMLRDLENGGRVEADHIVGWMLDLARRHGVDDTLLSLAFTHLKAFEARETPTACQTASDANVPIDVALAVGELAGLHSFACQPALRQLEQDHRLRLVDFEEDRSMNVDAVSTIRGSSAVPWRGSPS